jgi:NAD(P)-dependent dehydrogenase (short-subunit alcohol dehydrogenase family)
LKGIWNSLKYEIKQMKKQGKGGSIINCSSQCGLMSQAGLGAYSSSKHGVNGLTKVAALENEKKGFELMLFVQLQLIPQW